jgi:son of sevenless-like protein
MASSPLDLTKDVEYRDILLTTCTDFTTPEDLYAILARRFHEADTNIALHPEQRVAVRYK